MPPLNVLNFTSNPPLSCCHFLLCTPPNFPTPLPSLQAIITQSLIQFYDQDGHFSQCLPRYNSYLYPGNQREIRSFRRNIRIQLLGNVNPVHLQRIGKLTVCVGFIKVSLAFSCPFSIVKYDKRIYKIRLKAHFIFLMRLRVHGLQSGSRHQNFPSKCKCKCRD